MGTAAEPSRAAGGTGAELHAADSTGNESAAALRHARARRSAWRRLVTRGTPPAQIRRVPTLQTARLTTATTHDPLSAVGDRRLPPLLLAGYALVWATTALSPASRDGWLLENVLPLSILGLLGGMYRRWHLSDVSYLCVALFLALHAVGAHYGYAEVPVWEWLRAGLGGEGARNPYDRVVHFAFGLCWFYPTREALFYNVNRRGTATLFAVAAVLGASAIYEILEWGAARLVAPATAASFVGAQGDAWDAQQDMAIAWAGALVAAALTAAASRVARRRRGGAPTAARHALPAAALNSPTEF